MTNAGTVRDVLTAAGERVLVEGPVLRQLGEWAPPDATVIELLVGLGLVRPKLQGVVRACYAAEGHADEIGGLSGALEADDLHEHLGGAMRLWSAWIDAANRAAAARLEKGRSEAPGTCPGDRDVAGVEAEWYVKLARLLALELAAIRHHAGAAARQRPSSAPPTAPLPAPDARALLRQLAYARGNGGDPAAPFVAELAERTPEDLPAGPVLAGLMLVAPPLATAALALVGRELPRAPDPHEVLDAVDLWRLWRVSLHQDVDRIAAVPLVTTPEPTRARAALLQAVLTGVEHGLTILERQGRPLSAESAVLLTQAEVDLLPDGARIAVTWPPGGEAGTYEVRVDESGVRYVCGRGGMPDASALRPLVGVGAYPLTEVRLVRRPGTEEAPR